MKSEFIPAEKLRTVSIYSSAVCPNCRKCYHARLGLPENVVPPPKITIACQCQLPVIELDLFYFESVTPV